MRNEGEGRAICHGAASLVNGIVTGTGSSFGIGLETVAEVILLNDPSIIEVKMEGVNPGSPALAIECLKEILGRFDLDGTYGARISTKSDIPVSRGLKSSSAAANAIILAALDALSEEMDDIAIIKSGVKASFNAGVTITGAFDDTCATYLGDVVVADNLEMKILKTYRMNRDHLVLIHVPDRMILKKDVDPGMTLSIKDEINEAITNAMEMDHLGAMMKNGIHYGKAMGLDTSIATKAMDLGADAAGISGTGPATVILCQEGSVDDIRNGIGDQPDSYWISTTLNRRKAGKF